MLVFYLSCANNLNHNEDRNGCGHDDDDVDVEKVECIEYNHFGEMERDRITFFLFIIFHYIFYCVYQDFHLCNYSI